MIGLPQPSSNHTWWQIFYRWCGSKMIELARWCLLVATRHFEQTKMWSSNVYVILFNNQPRYYDENFTVYVQDIRASIALYRKQIAFNTIVWLLKMCELSEETGRPINRLLPYNIIRDYHIDPNWQDISESISLNFILIPCR